MRTILEIPNEFGIVDFECRLNEQPKITCDEEEMPYFINCWTPTKYNWDNIEIKFIDVEYKKQKFLGEWLNNYVETSAERMSENNCKKIISIKVINPIGEVTKKWTLHGTIIEELYLDNTNAQDVYDKIILNKNTLRRKILFEKKGHKLKDINYNLKLSFDRATLT